MKPEGTDNAGGSPGTEGSDLAQKEAKTAKKPPRYKSVQKQVKGPKGKSTVVKVLEKIGSSDESEETTDHAEQV